MEWYLKVVRDNYINFEGRARRKEYWMFALVNVVIALVLSILEGFVGLRAFNGEVGILSSIYALAIILPGLGVAIRRLHDIGKSGWWLLISFVPLIGVIVLLIFYVSDSKPGENQYGPNPKGVAADASAPTPTPSESEPTQSDESV